MRASRARTRALSEAAFAPRASNYHLDDDSAPRPDPSAMLPGSLLTLLLLPLAAWQARAAALTMELEASERSCIFADVAQAGEKIGEANAVCFALQFLGP